MRLRLAASLTALLSVALAIPSGGLSFQDAAPVPVDSKRVEVILGVMSRCPDAKIVENVFDKVLDRVGGLVDVRLVYIGSQDDSATYGVRCMHGELECKGNIQQLCAARAWQGVSGEIKPWADWWNFIQCQNYGPVQRIGDGAVARSCGKVVGKDWMEDAHECVIGEDGTQLLKDSITYAAALGITKSASILLGGQIICVHDSSWKDCPGGHEVSDFTDQIKTEWRRLNDL